MIDASWRRVGQHVSKPGVGDTCVEPGPTGARVWFRPEGDRDRWWAVPVGELMAMTACANAAQAWALVRSWGVEPAAECSCGRQS